MTEEPESPSGPSDRPSIALTTPFLALSAAVIALAAFLLGYVAKDVGHHDRPRMGIVRMHDGPGGKPGKLERLNAGTVESVTGNTVTIKTRSGETAKVKLGKGTFIVVRKAP